MATASGFGFYMQTSLGPKSSKSKGAGLGLGFKVQALHVEILALMSRGLGPRFGIS